MEYYSAIKKNEIMPSAVTWMVSEVSQTEKDKYWMISLICGIQKNDTNEIICKTEKLTDLENEFMVTMGEGCGGGID